MATATVEPDDVVDDERLPMEAIEDVEETCESEYAAGAATAGVITAEDGAAVTGKCEDEDDTDENERASW